MKSFKLGKKPPNKEFLAKAPKLRDYVVPQIVVPPTVDWRPMVKAQGPWLMYMNGPDPNNPPQEADGLGDCVWAGTAEILRTLSANAGNYACPTDAEVLAAYEGCTGFRPDDPSSDQGTDMVSAFKYMQTVGMGGQVFGPFATIDPHNPDEIRLAVYLCGFVGIGIAFPASWEDAQTWDSDPTDIQGGHFIPGFTANANEQGIWIVTWASERFMTFDAFDTNCDECLVSLNPEWVAGKVAPNMIDVTALTADFNALAAEET